MRPTLLFFKSDDGFNPELPDDGQAPTRKDAEKDIETLPPGGSGIIMESYRTDVGEWISNQLSDPLEFERSASFTFWGFNAEEDTSLEYDFWIDIKTSTGMIYETPQDSPFTETLDQDPKEVTFTFDFNASGVPKAETITFDLDFRSNRDFAILYDGYEDDGSERFSFLEFTTNAVNLSSIEGDKDAVTIGYTSTFNSPLFWKLFVDNVEILNQSKQKTTDEGKTIVWPISLTPGLHFILVDVGYNAIVSNGGDDTNATAPTYTFTSTISIDLPNEPDDSDKDDDDSWIPGFEAILVVVAFAFIIIKKRH